MPIVGFEDVQRIVSGNGDRKLSFGIDRGGQKLTLEVTPKVQEQSDNFGSTFRRGLIGITPSAKPEAIETKKVGFVEAVGLGVRETYHGHHAARCRASAMCSCVGRRPTRWADRS